jgi:hypothetical protein
LAVVEGEALLAAAGKSFVLFGDLKDKMRSAAAADRKKSFYSVRGGPEKPHNH